MGTGQRTRVRAQRRRTLIVLLCAVAAAGCNADYATSAPVDRTRLLASVVLNHHAIVLSTAAPTNTIQLAATATNPDGAPLAGLSVTYSLSDSTNVAVTPDGTLAATAPASAVRVVASVTDGNVTRKDSAFVYVTDGAAPPALATFSIQPPPGDSARMAPADPFGVYGFKQIIVQATDAGGVPVDALPAFFSSSDQSVAAVDPELGIVHAIRPGTVVIHASTTAYGVSMADDLHLTVIPPLIGGVAAVERTPVGSTTPVLAFEPERIVVSVGATVLFANNSIQESTDIVFDDPDAVSESPLLPLGAGNIAPFHADENGSGLVTRAFFTPGTYNFHSSFFDAHGTIVVQ